MQNTEVYKSKNKIRVLTAGSLFDGHDVAINIMRRIMQRSGAEVIHLGHNRSVLEIVTAAIQEDVQAIAITSYQGGHNEFFKYAFDLLQDKGAGHIKIFGGGGGTILPDEIDELHKYGITRIYTPDDGRALGLQGMINDLLSQSDFPVGDQFDGELSQVKARHDFTIARAISAAESYPEKSEVWLKQLNTAISGSHVKVLGITGTGGAGKSSLVDELVLRYLAQYPEKTLGIISVDPSKRKTGGALLGDRIRMNAISNDRVYMRSLATRQYNLALSKDINHAIAVLKYAGFDLIILETSGIGQSDSEIVDHADYSVYVMTPEFGAASQLEKIDMIDFADLIIINKFDKRGSLDAQKAVQKQYQRNHELWETDLKDMPVFGTIASQFNDPGVNIVFSHLMHKLFHTSMVDSDDTRTARSEKQYIIPPARVRYLSEITNSIRAYDQTLRDQAMLATQLYSIENVLELSSEPTIQEELHKIKNELRRQLSKDSLEVIEGWEAKKSAYHQEYFTYQVRDREIKVENYTTSLSQSKIPKVSLPKYRDWGEILEWSAQENVPGEFPFTAGVFPFKRRGEDPTRMFAGEGGPERTNKRFHYLSQETPAKRLSTAFDSVTLYGFDPDHRPDIYGKVGNSGVNISSLNDAKKLYSGFNLCHSSTSVSMTINGPAAIICAYYLNAAIDQQCELYIIKNGLAGSVEKKLQEVYDNQGFTRPKYEGALPHGNDGLGLLLLGLTGDQVLDAAVYKELKAKALQAVRGTVQADILKEDQAQNTCIFSTEFSLQLMGDVQQYFINHHVKNFYSVSISGYHIAEAGANPISQLAFTLSNGFTFIEYYLSRGMDIDAFAPNLSFFFSNGVDPEYAVIGRVARRIWAKALKYKYGANERSQKLKYHIQTSGRSLHAQEIDFNDIRTTLQALYAIYDNCNSLHTNAYDEAITTPTEDSVRRAVAIQMIINHELGLAKNENPLQGSFIIEELTDLVEEAVMTEFDKLSDRGGVLGAMESMYQRGKIQEESMHYEMLKHTGEYPIIGVNTFLSSKGSPTIVPKEVIRASEDEKEIQIANLKNLHQLHGSASSAHLLELKEAALQQKNVFTQLMETTKYCSLGQITHALFSVGGKYRRSM